MAITINGSGSISGISAGGLPDGVVTTDDLASTLDLSGKTVTLPTVSNLTLSGGVYLGGTGSANYLDDYEEGNWTPTVIGSSTAGSATYTTQAGTYIKIGNLVKINFTLAYSSGTGTGNLYIGGIPFSVTSTSQYESTGSVMTYNLNWDSGTSPVIFVGQNYNYLRIYVSGDNVVWDQQSYDAAINIIGTIIYQTDA